MRAVVTKGERGRQMGWIVSERKPIRVLLADDNPDVLQVMRRYLERQESFSVCGTAASADHVLDLAEAERPDVVVIDLTMPGKPTLEAVRELVESPARCPVIVLSGYDDAERVHAAMSAGASAYLSKDAPADRLVALIRDVGSRRASQGTAR